MALPSSGELSFSGINDHIRRPSTQSLDLNDAQVRGLAEKATGSVAITDLHGKFAGNRMTCGASGSNTGWDSGSFGSVEGNDYAGQTLDALYWSSNYIQIITIAGQSEPASRVLRIRDNNLNILATYTLDPWLNIGNNIWYSAVAASNVLPSGQVRWWSW